MTETHKTTKAERTRTLLMDTALELFRTHGFEKTTMRVIAKEAGLSVGSTYYYFPTKEHIIQAFYEATSQPYLDRAAAQFAEHSTPAALLQATLIAQLETSAPYHQLSVGLFRAAAAPGSSLSPFSEESRPLRERNIQLYAELIAHTRIKVSGLLAPRLPMLLWLYHMSVIAFWIFDRSPNQKRSLTFVKASVPLVVKMLGLSRFPPLKPVIAASLKLFDLFEMPGWIPLEGETPDLHLEEFEEADGRP